MIRNAAKYATNGTQYRLIEAQGARWTAHQAQIKHEKTQLSIKESNAPSNINQLPLPCRLPTLPTEAAPTTASTTITSSVPYHAPLSPLVLHNSNKLFLRSCCSYMTYVLRLRVSLQKRRFLPNKNGSECIVTTRKVATLLGVIHPTQFTFFYGTFLLLVSLFPSVHVKTTHIKHLRFSH